MMTADEIRKLPKETREQLREQLREPAIFERYLSSRQIITTPGKNFACPICGNGTKTPSTAYKDGRLTCFSSAHSGNNTYDFIDFIGEYEHVTGDYIDKLAAATAAAGIIPDSYLKVRISSNIKKEAAEPDNHANDKTQDNSSINHDFSPDIQNLTAANVTHGRQTPPAKESADFSPYIQKCAAQMTPEAMEYLTGRGFTPDFIAAWHIGYDAGKIVIPYEKNEAKYYCTRSITGKEYRKPKDTTEPLFNAATLINEGIVFVTEGQLDALAVEAAGFRAIGIGGTNGGRKLLDHVQKLDGGSNTYIILFDNDNLADGSETERKDKAKATEAEAEEQKKQQEKKARETGNKAEELKKQLTEQGATARLYPDILKNHHDPADFYRDNPEGFSDALAEAVHRALQPETTLESEPEKQDEPEQTKETYIATTSAAGHFEQFQADINDAARAPAISTGFTVLDSYLDGGLRAGLYVLGAMTGAGKTAYILQMADQIAKKGHDVMIFALEMSLYELMARSISRESYLHDEDNALTVWDVRDATRYGKYSEDKFTNLLEAQNIYRKYAERIFILEGMGDIRADSIRTDVENHIRITGNRPVVIVDYLQLLAPYENRATDKQNTDKNILEMKRISRDFSIPVIGISSMNRASYGNKEGVTYESFKESGAIEYSSDVLMGLNHIKDKAGADADTRYMELEILKNRNGRSGGISSYWYKSKYNTYRENMQEENAFTRKAAKAAAKAEAKNGQTNDDSGSWSKVESSF